MGADNKESLAAILETITILFENNLLHRPIEIVFTKEEEAISKGAKELDISLLKSKTCLISDVADKWGIIIRSAPYCFKFDIQINGVSTHARHSDKGINAITLAGKIINKIPQGKVDKWTYLNISSIIGSKKTTLLTNQTINTLLQTNRNTVPDLCLIQGEIRGPKIDKIENLIQKINDDIKKIDKKITFNVSKVANGYFHKTTKNIFINIEKKFQDQNTKPVYKDSFGGSDANILNARGIETILISSAHRNNHQYNEYLNMEELYQMTDFFLRYLLDK